MDVNKYTTVTEALQGLAKRGFSGNFRVEDDGLRIGDGSLVPPGDVTIVEYHRFEGETNPGDMSVVYALECKDGTRGVLIDAYGTYADPSVAEFIKKVELKDGL